MHDIVRDYAIKQHTAAGLVTIQRAVVDEILTARPDPGGFRHPSALGTFEGYVVRHLYWHLRGALSDGEEPPDEWMGHVDEAVKMSVGSALGIEKLVTLSEAREAQGMLVRAAEAAWVASLVANLSLPEIQDQQFRAADLLEHADDAAARPFELLVGGSLAFNFQ